ncbi:MAG: polyphosphate kinase 2, partial [Henriciella sp.]|nr:polyphosphate kinase 2 [Henriciella sp.]
MATNATGNGADKQTETPSKVTIGQQRHDPDRIRELFENGEYPYKTRMPRKTYERHKAELQVELLKVQHWVKETGQKIVILFEGR